MIKNLHNLMLMVCCFELLDAFACSFLLVYPLLKEVVSLAVKELIYSHYGCTDIFNTEAFLKKQQQLFESSCGIDELDAWSLVTSRMPPCFLVMVLAVLGSPGQECELEIILYI